MEPLQELAFFAVNRQDKVFLPICAKDPFFEVEIGKWTNFS